MISQFIIQIQIIIIQIANRIAHHIMTMLASSFANLVIIMHMPQIIININLILVSRFKKHIAIQISVFLKNNSVLFTGGGVFNTFLMERITYHSSAKIIIPSNNIINFKEAIIFGFLGVLRIRNEIKLF